MCDRTTDINNTKLTITINHKNPISLIDLATGLTALGNLYGDFTKSDKQAQLLVKEIRNGSIEIDLVTLSAVSVLPLLSNTNTIIQFYHYLNLLVATCSKRQQADLESLTREHQLPTPTTKDIKNFGKSLSIIGEKTDTIKFTAHDISNSVVYNNCTFTGEDAIKMQDSIPELVADTTVAHTHKKQLFKWVQVNFGNAKSGNKGIVKNLHHNALRVIFEDDDTKREMTETSSDGINWQDKYYTVDVEVQLGENSKPMQYKIIKHYAEASFYPDDDL